MNTQKINVFKIISKIRNIIFIQKSEDLPFFSGVVNTALIEVNLKSVKISFTMVLVQLCNFALWCEIVSHLPSLPRLQPISPINTKIPVLKYDRYSIVKWPQVVLCLEERSPERYYVLVSSLLQSALSRSAVINFTSLVSDKNSMRLSQCAGVTHPWVV